MLKRQGLIGAWHDRRIVAGEDVDGSISTKLEEAEVILLLVSADFLASDYCWGIEVRRAMERHDANEATVIPVILRPCDWKPAPFGKILATPTDARPVTAWADRDDAFLNVVTSIRAALMERASRAATSRPIPEPVPTSAAPRSTQVRSSNLAISKRFTEADKDDFRVRAFEHTAQVFEGSLTALAQRHPEIEARFRKIDANRFTAAVYRNGRKEAACTIWTGGGHFSEGINFHSSDSGETNTMNGSLQVAVGDRNLHLTGGMFTGGQDTKLSIEQGAEHLWTKFLEPLQRV